MDVRVGLWRKLSTEELMLLNYGVGEDSWGSLELQEIQPVHPKGDQSWVFFGRTDAKAETPVLWPPNVKSWPIGKTLMLGEIGGRRIRARQIMRWLDGITHSMDVSLSEFRELVDGLGSLVCCDSWGRKDSDTTEWLNWTELNDKCLPSLHGVVGYLYIVFGEMSGKWNYMRHNVENIFKLQISYILISVIYKELLQLNRGDKIPN